MKRLILILVVLGAALLLGTAIFIGTGPSLLARPVYSVPQITTGLTPRHNVWGGRTVWVRAVAVLGYDLGSTRNTVILFEHTPGASDGYKVSVTQPNATFTLLSWKAWIARHVPGMSWMYGEQPGVYRVRFFQPTWCFSCPAGQLE